MFLHLPPEGRTFTIYLTEIEAECSSVNKMLFSFSVPFSVTFHALFLECLSPPKVIFLPEYLSGK